MVLSRLDHPLSRKNVIVTNYLTKPQYNYKQASISFLVNHGPKILTTSVFMTLIKFLDHVCDPQYLKLTILAFFGIPRFAQNCHIGLFC